MESQFRSSPFRGAARKLLQEQAAPTPAPVLAPSPNLSPGLMCRDVATGAAVRCQNPHTLVIIVAGMACMMFLIAVALLLLCWSVVRQRRMERLRRELGAADPASSAGDAGAGAAPADSHKFDDAVLVKLPGDATAQFFALPQPFHGEVGPQQDAGAVPDVAIKSGDKELSSENPSSDSPC